MGVGSLLGREVGIGRCSPSRYDCRMVSKKITASSLRQFGTSGRLPEEIIYVALIDEVISSAVAGFKLEDVCARQSEEGSQYKEWQCE